MKTKILLLTMCIVLLSGSSMALEPSKKLGYGFGPGLEPGRDFVAGQLIVGMKPGLSINGVKQAASAAGIQAARGIKGGLLLQFASEQAAIDAVPVLASRSDVAFVERNGFMRIAPEPKLSAQKCGGCDRAAKADLGAQSVSDYWTGFQYYLTVIRKSADLGFLPESPPTVAVIDTGVDYGHIDLSGKVLLGKNCVADTMDPLDDNGHGTHVAGIIAGKVNGSFGEGVCDKCRILAVKVLGSDGTGTFFDVADGMQYARTYTNPSYPSVKIINMAFGGPDSALIAAEVLAIKSAGKVLVASAGDDNTRNTTNAYPGADPNTALRVMATNEVDCRAWFSNFSPSTASTQYNIAAPGWNIYSYLPVLGWRPMSGTSQASAIVAGTASLVWGLRPSLTPTQLVNRLRTYGKSTGCGFAANTSRVDLRKALLGTPETAIVGGVRDPFTGQPPYYSSVSIAKLLSDSTLLASDEVNAGGFYEMAGLTAGTGASLSVQRSGYISTTPLRSGIAVSSGAVAGPFLDAFPQARAAGNVTITLDWKTSQPTVLATGLAKSKLGWELDLYVKTPDGTYVGGDNRGDLLTAPYVKMPRDSSVDLLPMETIVISNSAPDGEYKVFADKPVYAGPPVRWNNSWTYSQASVQVYNGSTLISPYYAAPPIACGSVNRYWHIGNVTKTGTSIAWSEVNTCTNTKP